MPSLQREQVTKSRGSRAIKQVGFICLDCFSYGVAWVLAGPAAHRAQRFAEQLPEFQGACESFCCKSGLKRPSASKPAFLPLTKTVKSGCMVHWVAVQPTARYRGRLRLLSELQLESGRCGGRHRFQKIGGGGQDLKQPNSPLIYSNSRLTSNRIGEATSPSL